MKKNPNVHQPKKGKKCNICGKVFHRPINLVVHERNHTGERPFEVECVKKVSHLKLI